MLFVTLPFCLALLVFGMGVVFFFGVSSVIAEDVRVWPYYVSLLVKVLAFFGYFALAS